MNKILSEVTNNLIDVPILNKKIIDCIKRAYYNIWTN